MLGGEEKVCWRNKKKPFLRKNGQTYDNITKKIARKNHQNPDGAHQNWSVSAVNRLIFRDEFEEL